MSGHLFNNFVIEEVLAKVEGPSVFTLRLKNGSLFLAYLADVLEDCDLFMLFSTSESIVCQLKMDRLPVRKFMEESPAMFSAHFSRSQFSDISPVTIEAYQEYLPEPEEFLNGGFEHFTVKLVKPGLNPATAQVTNLEWVLRESKRALKELLSKFKELSVEHYEPASQSLNNAQCALLPGSLEVSFILKEEAKLLSKSCRAAYLINQGLPLDSELEREVGSQVEQLKECMEGSLYALSPTNRKDGHNYDAVVLGGSVFGKNESGTPNELKLNKQTRDIYSEIIKKKQVKKRLLDLIGRVGEIDKDALTFTLRKVKSNEYSIDEIICDYSEIGVESGSTMELLYQFMKNETYMRVFGEGTPQDKKTLLVTKFASLDGRPLTEDDFE